MLNKILVLSFFGALLGAGFTSAFLAGSQWDAYSRRITEVNNSCAHYDSRTGEFVWGATPMAPEPLTPLDAPPANGKPLFPKHKPKPPKPGTSEYFSPVE